MKINYTYSLAEYEAINKARQRRARFDSPYGAKSCSGCLSSSTSVQGFGASWPPGPGSDEDWIYLGNLAIAILLLAGRYWRTMVSKMVSAPAEHRGPAGRGWKSTKREFAQMSEAWCRRQHGRIFEVPTRGRSISSYG
ncbi:MAG: hypothetical protein R3D34_04890 [Nitratireductor sp.]